MSWDHGRLVFISYTYSKKVLIALNTCILFSHIKHCIISCLLFRIQAYFSMPYFFKINLQRPCWYIQTYWFCGPNLFGFLSLIIILWLFIAFISTAPWYLCLKSPFHYQRMRHTHCRYPEFDTDIAHVYKAQKGEWLKRIQGQEQHLLPSLPTWVDL